MLSPVDIEKRESMEIVKKLLMVLVVSRVLCFAVHEVLAAGPVLLENFDDGVANGFVEAGGTWLLGDGE